MAFILGKDNITLYAHREGNLQGHTLIFVNSLGSDYRIWDDVVPEFSDYDLIRYDLRGHGLSDCPAAPYTIQDHVDDLHVLIQGYDTDDEVTLIGISVGGMIAMSYAAQYPRYVKSLIVADTFPKIGTESMWDERINTLREHGMSYLGDAILERWFGRLFLKTRKWKVQGYHNMLTRMPVEGYTGTCEAIRDADLTESAKTISCPTLILCGAEDQSTPPSLVSGLTDIIPDSRYIEIENAGHLPCVENPAATANAINTFLKEVL